MNNYLGVMWTPSERLRRFRTLAFPALVPFKHSNSFSQARTLDRVCVSVLFSCGSADWVMKALNKHFPISYKSPFFWRMIGKCWSHASRVMRVLAVPLMLLPFTYLALVALATIEWTPITGRLRWMCLASTEEEILEKLQPRPLRSSQAEPSYESDHESYTVDQKDAESILLALCRQLEAGIPELVVKGQLSPNVIDTSTKLPSTRLLISDDPSVQGVSSNGLTLHDGYITVPSSIIQDAFDWENRFCQLNSNPQRLDQGLESNRSPSLHLLAFIIAHELSHLVLSHRLEAISSNLILPAFLNLCGDSIHIGLYPFFIIMGPFVHQGIVGMGQWIREVLVDIGKAYNSKKMEEEADLFALHLMDAAGFDPRIAVVYWSSQVEQLRTDGDSQLLDTLNCLVQSSDHPGSQVVDIHPSAQRRLQIAESYMKIYGRK